MAFYKGKNNIQKSKFNDKQMLQFQIVVNTLKVSNESTTVFSISKKDVYYIQTSLNEDVPKISLYNVNVGVFALVFQAPLSECSDPNGDPFTVNSFTTFAEDNLGFNSDGASSSITVTDSYATLPAPATVSGQFYWCENADGTFPVGLYYSDGTVWQFQTSENITVVANYSALPDPTTVSGQFYWCENAQGTFPVGLYYSNGTVWQFSITDNITVVANYSALPDPTTVNGQFFWAEASQGTSWLPAGLGGTYYSAGMYYSNGVSWSFLDVPYQATQTEVNTGTNTNKFVTPSTLKNQNYLAPLESPTFTGTPSAPTPTANTNSTTLATTAYADAKVGDAIADGVTTVAPSQNAVFDALAFTRKLITNASGSVTGTTSEAILTPLLIPANTLDSKCFIWTTMDFFKTNAGSVTARLYINTANNLSGATLIGFVTIASNRNISFNRKLYLNGTTLDFLTSNTASTQVNNEFIEALFGASTTLTVNPANDIYLIYTTQNDSVGTVATNKNATVQKMKLN